MESISHLQLVLARQMLNAKHNDGDHPLPPTSSCGFRLLAVDDESSEIRFTSISITFPASGWFPSTVTESKLTLTIRTRWRRPEVATNAVSRFPTFSAMCWGRRCRGISRMRFGFTGPNASRGCSVSSFRSPGAMPTTPKLRPGNTSLLPTVNSQVLRTGVLVVDALISGTRTYWIRTRSPRLAFIEILSIDSVMPPASERVLAWRSPRAPIRLAGTELYPSCSRAAGPCADRRSQNGSRQRHAKSTPLGHRHP